MNNSTCNSLGQKKVITKTYCKYCWYQRGKNRMFPSEECWLEQVSKLSYQELQTSLSPGEKERWSQVADLDKSKPICRLCYKNKEPSDLFVVQYPNYLALVSERLKIKQKKEKQNGFQKKDTEKENNKASLEQERLQAEGWIGPISKTCALPNCDSLQSYVKIRPPLSDDEPPMITYRCAKCNKTNLEYKQ